MKLLAWDTSSKAGAIVALEWTVSESGDSDRWSDVRLAGEWSLNVDSQHSERLLWGVHQLLESCRWRLDEIDLFGVGVGPGSFTGLRIGITTARTLAHTLGKPLIGVSSLAALARPVVLWLKTAQRPDVTVIATTDACKGELFALWGKASSIAGCVSLGEDNESVSRLWKRDVKEGVFAPDELTKAVKKKLRPDKASWLAIGEGRDRYAEAWDELPARQELELEASFPNQIQGRYLGMLVWEAWAAQLGQDPLAVHPRYVRASDAELKLRSGVLKRAPERVPLL